ncbi:MAG: tetratricopeptide repeat protein [Bacteroidetes bacterium]|nr:tetratricopeptide repeat protein [Bacteroidota bacterium]
MMALPPTTLSVRVGLCICMGWYAVVWTSAQGTADSAQMHRKATEYFINGSTMQIQGNRHAEAILEFQQALRYDSSAATLRAMAQSYAAIRKFDLALEAVQAAVRIDTLHAESWELMAEIYVTQGRYDEAMSAYERLRDLHPTKQQLYTLGRMYEPRDPDKAIAVFEQLVTMQPDEGVYRRLADLYARTRRPDQRTWTMERAMKLDPDDADLAAELAAVYVATSHMDGLDSILTRWNEASVTGGSEQVWLAAITAFLEDSLTTTTKSTAAQAVLQKASLRDARQWRVFIAAGALALRINESSRAFALFSAAIKAARGIADAPLGAAQSYMSFDRMQDAYDILSRSLVLFPYDPRFHYMMGFCKQQLDRDAEASQLYRRAIGIDSTYLDAWIQLGVVYDALDQMDSSDMAYDRALLLDPDNHLVNNNYAYSLSVRNKDLQRARSMSWRALQQYPANPAYLDTYAWVLYQLGEYDKARTYLERCIARGGGNATHYEHLGDVFEQLGLIDEAVRAWQESQRRDPERTTLQSKLSKYR